jgi:hypothetical protein
VQISYVQNAVKISERAASGKLKKRTSSDKLDKNRKGTQTNSGSAKSRDANTEMDKAKRRLMQIAVLVACLTLLNLSATVQQSATLESWSEGTDLWLSCYREVWTTRDWPAYNLVNGQSICSAKEVSWTQNNIDCQSPCNYIVGLSTAAHAEDSGVETTQATVCSLVDEVGITGEIQTTGLFYDWTFCEW